jgi:protein phosphatase
VYAWVGDSRIYHLPAGEALSRLTSDDGLLTELVRAGLLEEESAKRVDQATQPWHLTRAERIFFERRNGITQALGDELAPVIHVERTTILPGDRLLLCSDGVHDNLTDKELEALLRRGARTTVARHIVHAAALQSRRDITEDMRSKPDDMSAVVITCHY